MSQQNLLVLRYSRQYESPVPPKLLQPGSAMCEILNSGWSMQLTWSISAVLCRGSWHSVWFSPYKYIFGFLLSHRSYRIQLFSSVWISSNILFVFNICVASFFSWSDLGYNVAHFCPYTYMTYRHDVIREMHKLVCLQMPLKASVCFIQTLFSHMFLNGKIALEERRRYPHLSNLASLYVVGKGLNTLIGWHVVHFF